MNTIMDDVNTITSRTESLPKKTDSLVDQYIKTPSKSLSKSLSKGLSKTLSKTPFKTSSNKLSTPDISVPKSIRDIPKSIRDIPESIRDIPKSVKKIPVSLRDISPGKAVEKTGKIWMMLKVAVILLVVGFLFYKFRPIVSILTSLFSISTSLFSTTNKQFKQKTKGLDKQKEKPKKPKMKGVPSGTPNLSKQTILPKKDSGVKYKTPPPIPDDSMSEIQQKKQEPGYCYIGKWKGYRSCVDVKNPRDCYSGEIYPTKEQCIHPKTRS